MPRSSTSFGIHLTNRFPVQYSKGRREVMHSLTHGAFLRVVDEAEEESKLSSVWIGDNVLQRPRLAFMPVLGALAQRTKRLLLGTSCMSSFVFRHPILLANEWATLDILASGRLVMVPCMGTAPTAERGAMALREYRALGLDLNSRVGRFEEGIEAIRGLWTHDTFSFEGKHYSFKDVSLEVKPYQDPPPIWIANNPLYITERFAERSARRIARLADGWMTSSASVEEFVEWRTRITELGEREYARKMEGFPTCFVARVNVGDDEDRSFGEGMTFGTGYMKSDMLKEKAGRQNKYLAAYGKPDKVIEDLSRVVEAGPTYIDLMIASEDQIGQLHRLREEVLPSF